MFKECILVLWMEGISIFEVQEQGEEIVLDASFDD